MTRIYSEFCTRHLDNDRFVQMTSAFRGYSDELAKAGFDPEFEIPVGFVMDGESVPIVRGRNVRGGAVHDYFSCYDSLPVVTKQLAADVYFEFNSYCDLIDWERKWRIKAKDWVRRWSKWAVVSLWPGYFHKRSVMAAPEEIAGVERDPYMTVKEKLVALIKKQEKVTEEIEALPAHAVEEKPELVEESKEVVDVLEKAKEKVEK